MTVTAAEAARRRAEQVTAGRAGRRRRGLVAALPLVVLVAVVAVLVVVRVRADDRTPAPAADVTNAVVRAVTSVPPTVLDTVGTGGVDTVPIAINGPTVEAGGLPRVLWVGAEYCPSCAVMRWPLTVALARFGTFAGLALTSSSDREPYPGTATLTFRDATYRSPYLSFTPYETAGTAYTDGRYEPLQTPTADDRRLVATYDAPPYFPGDAVTPFVLFAGQYASAGTLFTPAVLDGLRHTDIATALSDPTSAAGRAVDGAANVLTAVLCSTTGNQPSQVCRSAAADAGRSVLGLRSGG